MPKSKTRDKVAYTPPADQKPQKIKIESSAWVPRFMVAFFVIGLAWMVLYYLASNISFINSMGAWNVVIGFGFIAGGFVISTRWR
ncbi:MAG TPA: cell division protein CrgA [Actinospica sp.]|nr:cell division protein CrgA [Actinospica sp.]